MEVYERVGKSLTFWSIKRPKRAKRCNLMAMKKSRKRCGFCNLFKSKVSAFRIVKRDAKF